MRVKVDKVLRSPVITLVPEPAPVVTFEFTRESAPEGTDFAVELSCRMREIVTAYSVPRVTAGVYAIGGEKLARRGVRLCLG